MNQYLDCTFDEARRTYLGNWLPAVFFQLLPEETDQSYRSFLVRLLDEFAACLRPDGARFVNFEPGDFARQEGSVCIYWGDTQFKSKLFWYNETCLPEEFGGSFTGLLFIDHLPVHGIDVEGTHRVYVMADAFERFLRSRQAAFARYNLKEDSKYVLQVDECPRFDSVTE